jgi:FSR family fosmidomycin resistance protein-like MFS transporter
MMGRARAALCGCAGVHAIQDGLGAVTYVLLPILGEAFGLSYAQIGAIRASTNAAMAAFEIPSGLLSERLGERVLLVFGLTVAGLAFVTLQGATGFGMVAACLFVAGVGAAFQHALSSAIVTNTSPEVGRRAALGLYNASGDAGKLGFTGAFTLAITLGFSWQSIVFGMGVVALSGAIGLAALLGASGVGGRPPRHGPDDEVKPAPGWGIRDRGAFTTLAGVVLADIAVQSSFLTFLAFLMLEKGVPASLAGLAVVVTLAGGMCGKFACGVLAERLGLVVSLVVVQLLTALGIVAIWLAPPLLSFFLLPVVGVVLQGSSSITYASVGDLVDETRRSRGFAAIYTLSSAGSIIAPLTFGVVSDHGGLGVAMMLMAALVVAPLPFLRGLHVALSTRAVVSTNT